MEFRSLLRFQYAVSLVEEAVVLLAPLRTPDFSFHVPRIQNLDYEILAVIVYTLGCIFQTDMDSGERFERTCQMLNKVLEQQVDGPVELTLDKSESEELVSALEYYRETVNPSSGDVLIRTEYICPECASTETFQAQDGQVSKEAEYSGVGVKVVKVDGIAQCSSCKMQIDLIRFKTVKLDGFDEDAFQELYRDEYQKKERVEKLQ